MQTVCTAWHHAGCVHCTGFSAAHNFTRPMFRRYPQTARMRAHPPVRRQVVAGDAGATFVREAVVEGLGGVERRGGRQPLRAALALPVPPEHHRPIPATPAAQLVALLLAAPQASRAVCLQGRSQLTCAGAQALRRAPAPNSLSNTVCSEIVEYAVAAGEACRACARGARSRCLLERRSPRARRARSRLSAGAPASARSRGAAVAPPAQR